VVNALAVRFAGPRLPKPKLTTVSPRWALLTSPSLYITVNDSVYVKAIGDEPALAGTGRYWLPQWFALTPD
jgi:hypothetical protein